MKNAFTLEELALIFKAKELEAIQKKNDPQLKEFPRYWDGKATAFSEAWGIIIFRGKDPSPEEYNKVNEKWGERVHKESPLELLEQGAKSSKP